MRTPKGATLITGWRLFEAQRLQRKIRYMSYLKKR